MHICIRSLFLRHLASIWTTLTVDRFIEDSCMYWWYVLIHAWYVSLYQYIPVCNGMYCARITFVFGMYTSILKLSTYQYVPLYVRQYVLQYGVVVLVCIQYIPARIGMYSGMYFACIVHLMI